MPADGSTPAPHRIGILMSAEGRFLECMNCRLRAKFPAGAHYDTIAKQFESQPCNTGKPSQAASVLT